MGHWRVLHRSASPSRGGPFGPAQGKLRRPPLHELAFGAKLLHNRSLS
jgi:hypothetical protein